jgi:hypothetical protein
MAQVLLLSVTPEAGEGDYNRGALRKLKESAAADRFRVHILTDDPVAADIILFAELHGAGDYFGAVRRHPLVKHFREKSFLFCPNDFIIPFLSGVYACIERPWYSKRTRSGFYLGVWENKFISPPPSDCVAYLYGFIGSVETARVRQNLATLRHARGFFQDVSAEYPRALNGTMSDEEMQNYRRRYVEVTQASKFILCPRGLGVSSVRLFDTMRMGRVPVILSDDWVEPTGPLWNEFSLRVPEREYAQIPSLLEQIEGKAVRMGELARRQWQEWFSPEACFHRTVEWCLEIKENRRWPESWANLFAYRQYLRPFHFRHALRKKYQALRETINRGGTYV